MRNFDEERAQRFSRERTFQIAGEVFTFRLGMHPEEFIEAARPYNTITMLMSDEDALAAHDQTVCNFLATDDDRERWMRLRSEKRGEVGTVDDAADLAITAEDSNKLILWIFEEQTGHPTNAPLSSGNGQRRSGPTSTAPSSSPPVASAA
jgi:hypothetical protein